METDKGTEIIELFQTLSTQAQTLLSELESFKQYKHDRPLPSRPYISLGKFRTEVQREAKLLQHHGNSLSLLDVIPHPTDKTQQTDSQPARHSTEISNIDLEPASQTTTNNNTLHQIRSSNISHLALIWNEVKRNTSLTGIRKQVRYTPPDPIPFPIHTNATAISPSPTPTLQPSIPPQSTPTTAVTRQQSSHTRQRSKIYVQRLLKAQTQTQTQNQSFHVPRSDKEHVVVDIICEDGRKWIKVFTKTQRWMMMDLAREGVVDLGEDGDDGEGGRDGNGGGDGQDGNGDVDAGQGAGRGSSGTLQKGKKTRSRFADSDVEAMGELKLVKMAKEFLMAAKTTRSGPRHQHPRVFFHLPKIEKGVSRDVDMVLNYIEQMGIVVVSADELQSRPEDYDSSLEIAFDRMTSSPPPVCLTSTLNIDCTILIALISDISHFPRSSIIIPKHYDGREARKDILGQLENDAIDPLLPNHIYPVLQGKRLVCTSKAVAHLKNIVHVMGSPTETKRSNILFAGEEEQRSDEEVRRQLRQLSTHGIPDNLRIPIEIVDIDQQDDFPGAQKTDCSALDYTVMSCISRLPRLSPLNRSVFFHGWIEDVTTISLNRVVSEWLDRAIDNALDELEEVRDRAGNEVNEEEFRGPKIMVCGRERSLLGTEK